jgi:hypothetical protein
MLNVIKPGFIRDRVNSSEKEMCKSIQLMLNNFNDQVLNKNEEGEQFNEKQKFMELCKKFHRLKDVLEYYNDTNYFGEFREYDHEIHWEMLEVNCKEIDRMKDKGNWDWEFVESCIEDVEAEIDMLEEVSYNEEISPCNY